MVKTTDAEEEDLYGFQMDEAVQFIEEYDPTFLDPHASQIIPIILLSQGYLPGMPLGLREKEFSYLPLPSKSNPFGLGYKPMEDDIIRRLSQLHLENAKAKNGHKTLFPPYQRTLNGMFVRKGEKHPCYSFPEQLIQDGIRKPGFEIFHDCAMLDEAPLLTSTKSDTEESLDDQALLLLFN